MCVQKYKPYISALNVIKITIMRIILKKNTLILIVIIVFINIIGFGCSDKNETNLSATRISDQQVLKIKVRTLNLIDTTAQNILLIGDSQAYFFMKGFNPT